jgi:hypothetical protein
MVGEVCCGCGVRDTPRADAGLEGHQPWVAGGLRAGFTENRVGSTSLEGTYHTGCAGEAIPALPPQPSPGRISHQGDEVGEGKGQRDIHTVLLAGHWPELLVVGLLLEQVPYQPLLLIQAPAAWGGWGWERGTGH